MMDMAVKLHNVYSRDRWETSRALCISNKNFKLDQSLDQRTTQKFKDRK